MQRILGPKYKLNLTQVNRQTGAQGEAKQPPYLYMLIADRTLWLNLHARVVMNSTKYAACSQRR